MASTLSSVSVINLQMRNGKSSRFPVSFGRAPHPFFLNMVDRSTFRSSFLITMAKIDAKNLFKIFGPDKNTEKALDLSRNGKSQEAVFEKTGCTVAVKDISFSVDGPEIFVIMGLSGSGKSTLLRCINRLIEPTSGEVLLDGDNLMKLEHKKVLDLRKKKTAMVFQHFGLLSHRTVLENAAFGLELMHFSEKKAKRKGPPGFGNGGPERPGRSWGRSAVRRHAAAGRTGTRTCH